jgi:hypothetical protein
MCANFLFALIGVNSRLTDLVVTSCRATKFYFFFSPEGGIRITVNEFPGNKRVRAAPESFTVSVFGETADQLRVNAAIGGKIDVFKKDSKKSWRDGMSWFIDFNSYLRFSRSARLGLK